MSGLSERDVERLAEVLCPPSHREGSVTHIVGQPAKFSPRRICTLHAVMARNLAPVVAAIRDEALAPLRALSGETIRDLRLDGCEHSLTMEQACSPCIARALRALLD